MIIVVVDTNMENWLEHVVRVKEAIKENDKHFEEKDLRIVSCPNPYDGTNNSHGISVWYEIEEPKYRPRILLLVSSETNMDEVSAWAKKARSERVAEVRFFNTSEFEN